MSHDLPEGWGDRNNQMSEKDMKLGGDAANRFANAYQPGGDMTYQSSEQVRAVYYSQQERQAPTEASLPAGWEEREKTRRAQQRQLATQGDAKGSPPTDNEGEFTAELALTRLTIRSLETLAECLERNEKAVVAPSERAAFAEAVKRAMSAMQK